MQSRAFNRSSHMRENLSTILMSILLALIVWFFAIDQENPLERQEFNQPIPIEVRGLSEGTQTLQDLTRKTVVLTLRAPARTLETVTTDDFIAYIDLANLPPGIHNVPVTVNPVNPEVEVIDRRPSELRVQIEPIISKTVPVEVEIMDSPAFSYDSQTPIVDPGQVTITGPRTQVEQVTRAVAEVFLRNARSQVEQTQTLVPRNAQNLTVERVNVEPQGADVVVPIVQRPGRKEVAVVVQVEGDPAPGYRLTSISSEPGTVILRGSPEALLEVGGSVETPIINIENATGDIRERKSLILPENVSTLGEPSVTAIIGISPIESSIPVSRLPTVQGLNSGLRATVAPEQIDVIVSGPLPQLDALSLQDVQVTLDLTGLLPGRQVVTPKVVVPEGLQIEGMIPQNVEVTIESLITPTSVPGEQSSIPTPTATPTPADEASN